MLLSSLDKTFQMVCIKSKPLNFFGSALWLIDLTKNSIIISLSLSLSLSLSFSYPSVPHLCICVNSISKTFFVSWIWQFAHFNPTFQKSRSWKIYLQKFWGFLNHQKPSYFNWFVNGKINLPFKCGVNNNFTTNTLQNLKNEPKKLPVKPPS